ncbi:hypothetical protein [Halomarina oriensis]|uniref:Uncharacterized protein n=1 Tax=Halomarina oriensis TaxID=671145 RepID=A0A6B0GVY0_9EURY|nr:hypothetical protein [Halomarina oriensis]MWG36733.1 hypothetical protein [Halomarina oriensis]
MPSIGRGVAVLVALLVLAGCLGLPESDSDVTTNGSATLEYAGDYLDDNGSEYSHLAAVEYADGRVVVTGRVTGIGDESCLTMDVAAARENGTLVVGVTPGADTSGIGGGCGDSAKLWEFRAAVDVDAPPDRVVVELDGERFAATDTYDGSILGTGDGLNETT